MKISYKLDNELYAVDDEGDGEIDHYTEPFDGTTNITEPTEIGEFMRELNDDTIDEGTGMSSIDMKSDLDPFQVSGCTAIETLIICEMIPRGFIGYTRQIKRNSCSKNGRGRDDMVKAMVGEKEHKEGMGSGGFGQKVGDSIKTAFGVQK